MEKMDSSKMGADKLAENTPNAPKLIYPDFEAFSTRYWHLQILKPRALFYRTDCTRRSKFLTRALRYQQNVSANLGFAFGIGAKPK